MITKTNISITGEDRVRLIALKQKLFSPKNEEQAFYELCFCICSPQTKFALNTELNKELQGKDFFNHRIPYKNLCELTYKVRFYNRKAVYLLEAKTNWKSIWEFINKSDITDFDKRLYLVKNVQGLGMKTASHFLRNVLGCEYFAIIDTHILKFLQSEKYANQFGYYMLEKEFMNIDNSLKVTPIELDLFIFSYYSGIPLEEVR
jgi:N-glycosylase/DNA lyase